MPLQALLQRARVSTRGADVLLDSLCTTQNGRPWPSLAARLPSPSVGRTSTRGSANWGGTGNFSPEEAKLNRPRHAAAWGDGCTLAVELARRSLLLQGAVDGCLVAVGGPGDVGDRHLQLALHPPDDFHFTLLKRLAAIGSLNHSREVWATENSSQARQQVQTALEPVLQMQMRRNSQALDGHRNEIDVLCANGRF